MSRLELLERATARVREAVAAVGAEDWGRPTPCPAWDVSGVVEHLIRGQLGYTAILTGADGRVVLETIAARHDDLDADPLVAFDQATTRLAAAFGDPGALDRDVAHPMGMIPASRLLLMAMLEVTVHGWDLTVATGGPDHSDPQVVELLLAAPSHWLPDDSTLYFSPPAAVGNVVAIDALVALVGRQADWQPLNVAVPSSPCSAHL